MCKVQYFISIFLVESERNISSLKVFPLSLYNHIQLLMFLLVLKLNFYCCSHTHLVKLDGVEYADYKMWILSTRFSDEIREQKNLIYVQFYWANQNRYQALVNIRAYSVVESPSVSASSVLSV